MSKADWGPEYVVDRRYRLINQLGKGGMGSVWRAQHLTLNSPVAIKLIDPAIASQPDILARFLREAQSAAALRSPHVVQILDYGVHDGVPFIAMELMEGESLAGRLQRVGRLSPEQTARVIVHVARAIGRAHEAGIVHRDLKPDNIFLVRNGDEEVAKVLDFGIAKKSDGVGQTSQTRTGAILGTPYYMSPEQAEGNKSVDFRSDLWAMGVIAFECLVGRRPFESDALGDLVLQICVRPVPTPSSWAPVPAGFDGWFERAVQRAPEQRFQSAKELANTLRAICGAGSLSDAHGQVPLDHAPLPAVITPSANTAESAAIGVTNSGVPARSAGGWALLGLGAVAALGAGAWFAFARPEPAPASGSPPPGASAVPTASVTQAPEAPATAPTPPKAQPDSGSRPRPQADEPSSTQPARRSTPPPKARRTARSPQPSRPPRTGPARPPRSGATTKTPEKPPEKPAAPTQPPPRPTVDFGI